MKEKIEEILIKRRKYRDPDYSAAALAEALGISVFTLSRVLKREFGKSYSDITNSHRVKDACKYLKSPQKANYTVDDIGIFVGFKNRQSFFDAFKKFANTTPEKYRNEKND